jgi:hypothetical protein
VGRKLVQEVLDFSQTTGRQRLVLIAWADRAHDDTRVGFASVPDLRVRAGGLAQPLDPRDTRRLLKAIETLGELELLEQGGGRHRSARRRLVELDPAAVEASEQQLDLAKPGVLDPPFGASKPGVSDPSFGAPKRGVKRGVKGGALRARAEGNGNRNYPPGVPPRGDAPELVTELDEQWQLVRAELQTRVPELTFHVWLEDLRLAGAADGRLFVIAPERTRSWVADRYVPLLEEAAAAALGGEVQVELAPAEPLIDEAARKQRRNRAPRRRGRALT